LNIEFPSCFDIIAAWFSFNTMHWLFSYIVGISWKLFSNNPVNMAKDFREQHLLGDTIYF